MTTNCCTKPATMQVIDVTKNLFIHADYDCIKTYITEVGNICASQRTLPISASGQKTTFTTSKFT